MARTIGRRDPGRVIDEERFIVYSLCQAGCRSAHDSSGIDRDSLSRFRMNNRARWMRDRAFA